MTIFRSSLFWLLCVLAGLAAGVFTKAQFSRAFPILDQPLTMSREGATREAVQLAQAQGWSPGDPVRTSARLWHNADLTTFIELEAGGKNNLRLLLGEGVVTPYRWQVRLFQPKNAAETLVQFRPDGRLLGFLERLPEVQAGRELPEADARTLAEAGAAALGIDLHGYHLVESKSNRVVSGRLDRSFTYERPEPRLDAGRDQVVLTVRGDRFCGVEPGVKLPDDFFRRYTALRASNTNLQLAANLSIFVLLGLGGCFGGLIYLARLEAIDWRGTFVPAGLLALGSLASALNLAQLSWFGYDTALSLGEFQTKALLAAVLASLGMLIFVPVLAAAEGLGRIAFPQHPLLWKAPSRRAAGSRQVVGAVLGGYVAAALFFGYEVLMARFGVQRLGWWMPSSARFDPGLLAASFPWISPVYVSFMAGLTEECLFRALPLAGAALLGRKFGRPGVWIGACLVLQALMFGAAHSSYPTMPGWARMAELFAPALCFGGLYLRFGILPGIVTHFLYDLVWLGLPLFADRAPGASFNIALLGAFALAPLGWAVACRARDGSWMDLPTHLRNAGWVRRTKPAAPPPPPTPTIGIRPASPAMLRLIFVSGLAALVAWVVSMSLAVPSMPGLSQRRAQAIAEARAALGKEGVMIGPEWEALAVAHVDSDNERLFVWRTAGQEVFQKLAGNALSLPGWRVRFLRSGLPLPDRAEEYRIFLAGDGRLQRYEHVLPESRPGAHLPKAQAQGLAEREFKRVYGLEAHSLVLVSADETKQPARSDWRFIWKDPNIGLKQGESRFWISMGGDALCGFERHVFVPEEWTRAQAPGDNARNLTTTLTNVALALALIAAVVAGATALWKHPFAWRAALAVAGFTLAVTVAQFFVKLPARQAWWSTNESLQVQTIRMGAGAAVGALFAAVFFGALAGMGTGRRAEPTRTTSEYLAGLGVGFLLLGAERLVESFTSGWHPWHPGIDGANSGLTALGALWIVAMLFPMALGWIRVYSALPARRGNGIVRSSIVAALGLVYGASFGSGIWTPIVLSAVLFAIAFVLLDRLAERTHSSILVAVVTARCVGKAGADIILPGQPDALRDGFIAVGLVLLVSVTLYRLMRMSPPAPAQAQPPLLPSAAAGPTLVENPAGVRW